MKNKNILAVALSAGLVLGVAAPSHASETDDYLGSTDIPAISIEELLNDKNATNLDDTTNDGDLTPEEAFGPNEDGITPASDDENDLSDKIFTGEDAPGEGEHEDFVDSEYTDNEYTKTFPGTEDEVNLSDEDENGNSISFTEGDDIPEGGKIRSEDYVDVDRSERTEEDSKAFWNAFITDLEARDIKYPTEEELLNANSLLNGGTIVFDGEENEVDSLQTYIDRFNELRDQLINLDPDSEEYTDIRDGEFADLERYITDALKYIDYVNELKEGELVNRDEYDSEYVRNDKELTIDDLFTEFENEKWVDRDEDDDYINLPDIRDEIEWFPEEDDTENSIPWTELIPARPIIVDNDDYRPSPVNPTPVDPVNPTPVDPITPVNPVGPTDEEPVVDTTTSKEVDDLIKELDDRTEEIQKELEKIDSTITDDNQKPADEDKKPVDDDKKPSNDEDDANAQPSKDKVVVKDIIKEVKEAVRVPAASHNNPKTGVADLSAVAGTLAISMAGIIATRKKND